MQERGKAIAHFRQRALGHPNTSITASPPSKHSAPGDPSLCPHLSTQSSGWLRNTLRSLVHPDLFSSGGGQTRAGLRGWVLEGQTRAGERVLEHRGQLPPPDHALGPKTLASQKASVRDRDCLGRAWPIHLSPSENSNRRMEEGKGGAEGGARPSHCLLL